jgi:hypothetical protein
MPPLKRVESALRQATEFFAAQLASPGHRPPPWSEFEWTMAKAAAVLHGVTPLLATTLQWRGPAEWNQFLSDQHAHTLLRHRRIQALLLRIDEAARRENVSALSLKGSALHALGLYCAGQRPMADIDLLVEERELDAMLRILEGVDYRQTSATWKHRILQPREHSSDASAQAELAFGEHSDAEVKIELHTRIAERLPLLDVDATTCILPSDRRPGLNGYPSTAALFKHLLLHAAGNMVTRGLRLIHLHDISLVAARMSEAEWAELLRSRVSQEALWWAVPPLELAARYYANSVPSEVLEGLRPGCPRALRTASRRQMLSDVSYAALRIETFPGLMWTDSLSEKLRCIQARVRPGPEQRAVHAVLQTERWNASNGVVRRSFWRRGLEVLLTRPPRPAPMYIVRAAIRGR